MLSTALKHSLYHKTMYDFFNTLIIICILPAAAPWFRLHIIMIATVKRMVIMTKTTTSIIRVTMGKHTVVGELLAAGSTSLL